MEGNSEFSTEGEALSTILGKLEGKWLGPTEGALEWTTVGASLGTELGTL